MYKHDLLALRYEMSDVGGHSIEIDTRAATDFDDKCVHGKLVNSFELGEVIQ